MASPGSPSIVASISSAIEQPHPTTIFSALINLSVLFSKIRFCQYSAIAVLNSGIPYE